MAESAHEVTQPEVDATKAPAKPAPAKAVPAKAVPAKKALAKAVPAKKALAKAVPAKKAPASKAPASKAPAKRAAASKAPATTTAAAKKAPAASPATAASAKPPTAKKAPTSHAAPTAVPTVDPASPAAPEWSDEELASFRAALDADVARLREELHMGQADMDELLSDSNERSGDDQADAGSKTLEREQEMSVNANASELLEQSMHALARLDAGTYGSCESCEKAIPAARLRAFPRATLCIACKQSEERR